MIYHLIDVGFIISFLVDRKKNNSIGNREWNDLCKCQFIPGSLAGISFLVRTSALLNKIYANCF